MRMASATNRQNHAQEDAGVQMQQEPKPPFPQEKLDKPGLEHRMQPRRATWPANTEPLESSRTRRRHQRR